MTPTRARPARRHRAIITGTVLLVVAATLPALAAAAPSPGEVRECIESNLPRYSTPGTAVTAQYADVEAVCEAGLEDGSVVSVEFDPAPADRDGATATPDPGSGGTSAPRPDVGGSDGGGASGSAGTEAPSDLATPSRPRSTPRPRGDEAPKPAAAGSEERVAAAIAQADSGVGPPFPSSLSDASGWLLLLIGAAAALVVGAAARAVRRRLN